MAHIDNYGVEYSDDKKTLIRITKDIDGDYSILDGVTEIGVNAFRRCRHLTNVTIPKSVISIEKLAFCDCRKLTSVHIPEGVTKLGFCAFSDCNNLESISLPRSLVDFDPSSIADLEKLQEVIVPQGEKSRFIKDIEEFGDVFASLIPLIVER